MAEVKLKNLTKKYGEVIAVQNMNLMLDLDENTGINSWYLVKVFFIFIKYSLWRKLQL